MSRISILIVEGDPLARAGLRELISPDTEFEVIGESATGSEAIAAHRRLLPDIVLLDVQTPGIDGFEIVRSVAKFHPLVIFTSAHSGHAQRAYEADVFDYLLKPVCRRRLQDSLRRAKARLACERQGAANPVLFPRLPDRIAVRNNGSLVFLKLDEIDWFEAADNYVVMHRGRETHLVRTTMNELEAKLDPSRFVRVHRSTIVNLDRVRELRPWFRGDDRIILRDGTALTLTKRHRGNLQSRLLLGAA